MSLKSDIKKIKSGDIIEVAWEDTLADNSWTDINDIDYPKDVMYSCGYYVGIIGDRLVLTLSAQTIDNEVRKISSFKYIPLGCILKVRLVSKQRR